MTQGRRGPGAPRVGIGTAHGHHGELVQGAFSRPGGALVRALLTLPHRGIGSRVVFHPEPGAALVLPGPGYEKVGRAVELTLRALFDEPPGGRVEVTGDVPRGVGMGSSTSDVTAAIRAVADSRGAPLPDDEVARLAALAEGACDSIMVADRVVLFAQREGAVVETLAPRLPPMVVVGCDTDPGVSVDTLAHEQPRYGSTELATFGVLRSALRRSLTTGDVGLLGRAASASARINQRFLPKQPLDFLLALAEEEGACGVQVAHSGTVAGVIFDPARPDTAHGVYRAVDRIGAAGLPVTSVLGESLVRDVPVGA
ncbi:GHMP kinase [Actinokineospora sp. NBRC 105648]|uniref:GHMP family kinase ATP-binding protein n=1 Tax=Actinokineospora sp. NBRC 105648 TaxID=3032206 RepID=UPI0024A45F7A|nr:GHMP kinase [Actinokineospora sp. NBRC 105648]GLZ41095.1 kinase [Actinokineospora sp. NBRC 105648]